jgi:H+/gluconate symporter-like permease
MKGRDPENTFPPITMRSFFLIGFIAFVPFAAKTFTHFTIYTIKKFSSLISHLFITHLFIQPQKTERSVL